jgi:acetolactate synthase-1/2/3 large subunit
MRVADAFIAASAAAGIDVCFANAGTSEMAIVDAMSRTKAIRGVPTLFEGVASGAADGYARIAQKPASVLLHLGPGLANASANFHNARRGRSPVVAWVGEHATWLQPHDPPLSSNIEAIALGTSRWIRRAHLADEVITHGAQAVEAAFGPHAGVATMILPMDLMEAKLSNWTAPDIQPARPNSKPVSATATQQITTALREAKQPLLLMGGLTLDEQAMTLAHQIARAVDGRVMIEQFPRCMRRSPHLPDPPRLAYLPFQARAQLATYDCIVLFGADEPVCFFGYDGQDPSLCDAQTSVLDGSPGGYNGHEALAAVAAELGAERTAFGKRRPHRATRLGGGLHPAAACQILAQQLPEDAIVVCEGITSSLPLHSALSEAPPHDLMTCKGGAIGFGIPAAVGAAIAAPDRRIVAYVGDGSAAYTLQGLWTLAREGLDVTIIVLVNHRYAVLELELMRIGAKLEDTNHDLTHIGNPALDYLNLAAGFGVPAKRAADIDAFKAALTWSLATEGPTLISAELR